MINLHFSSYQNRLKDMSQLKVEEEPSDFLNRLYHSRIFEFENSTNFNQFPVKIQKTLQKIAKLKIGQNLLSFLVDHQTRAVCLELSEEGFRFSQTKNRISININSFIIWKNDKEEAYWKMPFKVSFIHELIHLKHSLENEKKYREMAFVSQFNPAVLLNPDLNDPEEQLTICGIDCYQNDGEISLCENHFRYAWNLPLRFTHIGIKSAKKVIQDDVPIEAEQFANFFKSYWQKLPADCYRKEALILDIAEPTLHQRQLMNAIEPFVIVHNLAKVTSGEAEDLKTYELWDQKLS